MGRLVTVKLLKPYYIKIDKRTLRVILAYKYFSVFINGELYQFIPVEEKEIRINRKTKQIENIGARFAFQRNKNIVYIAMTKLISLPDFLLQLNNIIDSYHTINMLDIDDDDIDEESKRLIAELERHNVKRLIDHALDERNERAFNQLVKYL